MTSHPLQAAFYTSTPLVSMARVQARLNIGRANDAYEQEADAVADHVSSGNPVPAISSLSGSTADSAMQGKQQEDEQQENLPPAQRKPADNASAGTGSGLQHGVQSLKGGGQALPKTERGFFESRIGADFGQVRVHNDAGAAQLARSINARAFTRGSDVVFNAGEYAPHSHEGRKLLAHELTHVVQQNGAGNQHASANGNSMQGVQRKIEMKSGTAFAALNRKKMLQLWRKISWKNASMRRLAKTVMLDMHASADSFYFDSDAEVKSEIEKRVNTSLLTQQTQTTYKGGKRSFGYPFTSPALLYGPRVNYAARKYWTPGVSDNYAWRGGKANRKKNDRLKKLSRSQRYQVYGDQSPGYKWSLSSDGKSDPYSAIRLLFISQSRPRYRSLMHCDYMLATVHFHAFMRSTSKADFKSRVTQYGADKIRLTYDMDWAHLRADVAGGASNKLASLQLFVPKSAKDLVIGDHVTFFNHPTYNLINKTVGNAWKLENAVLIYKTPKGVDVFLGHGSGRKTDLEMRQRLAKEYNIVAGIALRLKARAEKGNAAAKKKLEKDFHVFKVGSEFRIIGSVDGKSYNKLLTKLKAAHIPGLRNPKDMSKMYLVVRPRESMR